MHRGGIVKVLHDGCTRHSGLVRRCWTQEVLGPRRGAASSLGGFRTRQASFFPPRSSVNPSPGARARSPGRRHLLTPPFLLASPSMADGAAAAMETSLSRLAPDLRYLLDTEGVPPAVQQTLADAGYISVRLFSMVDTEARGVKEFCRTDLGLDPSSGAEARLNVAKVLSVWMTATSRVRAWNQLDSTANTSNLPKVLPKSEHLALRAAFEAKWYRLEEKRPRRST